MFEHFFLWLPCRYNKSGLDQLIQCSTDNIRLPDYGNNEDRESFISKTKEKNINLFKFEHRWTIFMNFIWFGINDYQTMDLHKCPKRCQVSFILNKFNFEKMKNSFILFLFGLWRSIESLCRECRRMGMKQMKMVKSKRVDLIRYFESID